ncbi:hypothetical protein H4R18_002790 [Coemansia javaensis]|uniref:DUF8032 domain-containing protein n=1 Tax=Coemansia javaensis TaxID=2761396 RepID=A0A9W8LIM5_9FUNG|nr:hypothetical protein H4R18_002790 [Coemansia javaensis]
MWPSDSAEAGLLPGLLGGGGGGGAAEAEDGGYGGITSDAVLRSLRSLDDLERRAALPPDGRHIDDRALLAEIHAPHAQGAGAGPLSEEELSAVLEQICRGSLVADLAASEHSSIAPTPRPDGAAGRNDDSDGGGPLEMEELALCLTDPETLEAVLGTLSLDQLRQCAAAVNDAVSRRESAFGSGGQASPTAAAAAAAGDMARSASPDGGDSTADAGPAPTALSLLHRRLSPATADCVIEALHVANLGIPVAPQRHQAPGSPPPPPVAAQAASAAAQGLAQAAGGEAGGHEPQLAADGEGVPWLSFVYAQKGKPRRHRIRIDVERASPASIPASFRSNNCVYPRANCAKAAYAGNRWSYETECNVLGWKLAFLNQELLAERRGLLQTAVNNYRAMVAGRKSRRIARMEKAEHRSAPAHDNSSSSSSSGSGGSASRSGAGSSAGGAKRPLGLADLAAGKRSRTDSEPGQQLLTPPPTASGSGPAASGGDAGLPAQAQLAMPLPPPAEGARSLLVTAFANDAFARIRIHIDFGAVDASAVDQRFKHEHAVFPRALNAPRARYGGLQGRWEFELACNELAWRLAWLNKARLRGRKPLIQKCLDAYREHFAAPPWALLLCYREPMGGSVDTRFSDYWRPRPHRRRMDAVLGRAPVPDAVDEDPGDAVCSAAPPQPPSARPPRRPPPPPSPAGPAPHQPRPRAEALAAAATPPRAPAIRPRVASGGPAAGPAAPAAHPRPAPPPPPAEPSPKGRGPRPSTAPPTAAPESAAGASCAQPPPGADAGGAGSEKSAKAQAAAGVLTDVLRRLAKTDPSLTSIAGVLGARGAGPAPAPAKRPQAGGEGEDEDEPLDAKVAELERLITEIQNK